MHWLKRLLIVHARHDAIGVETIGPIVSSWSVHISVRPCIIYHQNPMSCAGRLLMLVTALFARTR